MAVCKSSKKQQQSYISVPSQIISSISHSSLESLLVSPKKKQSHPLKLRALLHSPGFLIFLIFLLGFLWMLRTYDFDPSMPFSRNPCAVSKEKGEILNGLSSSQLSVEGKVGETYEESGFWKQPDGMGYRPCLDFSERYRREGDEIVKDRTKYLMVVVSGGMNQQKNQIVDAVVIARILGAALVVPILQVNVIWGDERYALLAFFFSFAAFFVSTFLVHFVFVFFFLCFFLKFFSYIDVVSVFAVIFAVNFLIYLIWIISRMFWQMM